MPTLDRAPFNALVDDDGSNLIGSIWNKAAIASTILNPVDAVVGGPFIVNGDLLFPIAAPLYNDFQPSTPADTVWLLDSTAMATTITGIVAAPNLTQRLVINVGPNPITFANQHTGSAVPNRFIGPGFANFSLPVWHSVWLMYVQYVSAWAILKP